MLTFQARPKHQVIEPVRRRPRAATRSICGRNADYLAYALIDAYFPLFERMVVERPEVSQITRIHDRKRDLLTMRATIFVPLTLIAGVHGMNFGPAAGPWNMPEFGWRYGHPATLLAMTAITGGASAQECPRGASSGTGRSRCERV